MRRSSLLPSAGDGTPVTKPYESRTAVIVLAAAAGQFAAALAVAEASRHAHATAWLAVVVATVLAAFLVALGFGLDARSTSARLARMKDVLAAVDDGDLTQTTGSTRTDELGRVEAALDAAVARVRHVVGTVQQGLDIFHDGRVAVASLNKEMLETAELTAGQAYDVGVSAGNVSDSIQVVASSTEELIATVNEIARHATLAADIAYTAVTQSAVADTNVQELSAALQRVDEIANVITTIASQTHLLALNASIEAARAGEAGLGFAVVAVEVKELSKATADATEQVRAIVSGIHEGSARASAAINEITKTVSRIQESTASIASAVTEQTATTREVGRVSAVAAQGAWDISGRVEALHTKARDVAYSGAGNDASRSKDFALLESGLRAVVDGFNVGEFDGKTFVDIDDEEEIDQVYLNKIGTTTRDGVTRILHNVLGTGLQQWNYEGSWLHGDGYEGDQSGDSYSSVTGDSISLRFTGTKLRFVGTHDQQQGMAEVWIDDNQPVLVDFYADHRGQRVLWESPDLQPGEHTWHLRVAGKKHPESRYFWVAVASVEIS
ncbi:MAG: hypothetical protein QOF57_2736 [Frankiaceae bacterium]|nr:hypothetical protein [Frankiaceae bacterium]